jgi:hypothetical protein
MTLTVYLKNVFNDVGNVTLFNKVFLKVFSPLWIQRILETMLYYRVQIVY